MCVLYCCFTWAGAAAKGHMELRAQTLGMGIAYLWRSGFESKGLESKKYVCI